MTTEPTDDELAKLFTEETGFDVDDFPAAILDSARAARVKWGQPSGAGERVYAFRRKGLADFCTCDEARYEELSNKPHLFETRIFYTAPQPSPQQDAQHLAQALTDRENQPNQYGVEFGMSGTHMHFKIGNQLFKLAYEPDEQEEFDFMKRMLVNAFSTFTHGVKTAPPPSPTAQAAESVPAVDYPPLPARRRAFLCTKCGGRECEPGTIGESHPPCKCGYLGFAEDLDFTADDMRAYVDADRAARAPAESVGRDAPAAGAVAGKWPVGWSVSRAGDAWTVVAPDGQRRVWHEKTTSHDDSVFMWAFLEALNGPRPSPTDWAAVSNPAYEELPDSLICAVDQWFADNIKDSDGCTTQDVSELAEIFYGVTHEGGRESVDDALAIVKSFGPGIGGINDTYARQVLLAEEVERIRGQATNAKKTGELLMGLAVIRELTGTQQKGLEETIEAVRAAVSAQKHPPAPAIPAVNDDLRDRLVAISEAVAYQDDRAAQAMLREILKAPQAESRPAPAPVLLSDEELCQIEEPYLLNFRIPLGGQYDFARAVEKAVICKMRRAPAHQGATP